MDPQIEVFFTIGMGFSHTRYKTVDTKQWHNFGLKSGGTKLQAPRIKMLKASRGVRKGEGNTPPSQLGGLGQWSNYIVIYEGVCKLEKGKIDRGMGGVQEE